VNLDHIEAIWQDPGLADFYRQIASFARLIAFDKRGTGVSDRLPAGEEVRLGERMDGIRAVMDAVGVERAVVVGQADGVPVATVFRGDVPGARERADRVCRVGADAAGAWLGLWASGRGLGDAA
jgi:pimeloyl-ACP methyl ester carboxylesterase